jgi:tetratricopeptide (TPR) repeat protein
VVPRTIHPQSCPTALRLLQEGIVVALEPDKVASTMKNEWRILAAVCALVIGVYAFAAHSGVRELLSPDAADTYYNLLVRGFRAGQLSLKKEAPPGLTQLANPYDPKANARYRSPSYGLYDLTYYKGKVYMYFGVTPALVLFWPFVALTGRYLFHREAVVIFSAVGFLASVTLLRAVWQRCFSEVSVWVVAACALALGLATGVPFLLARCDVYEVPISCGYALTMLALGEIWRALNERERSWRWLAAASVAYGLAVGARPSLLFGAMILLVPVAQARHEQRPLWPMLAAATVPITLIGLGLMLYNELRFDNPLEFGWRYQLAGERQVARHIFNPQFLWFNFRVYFLQPARWSIHFPFLHEIAVPPKPPGYGGVETPFGVLTNIPLVWLALAVPLAWRARPGQNAPVLRWLVVTMALLFAASVLTLLFFISATIRYEVEFLPELFLLAVVGILGLESALADRPVWRRAARCGWGALLGFSVAFNLLASVQCYAIGRYVLGEALVQVGRLDEAIQVYEEVLRLNPDYTEAHLNLGNVLYRTGQAQDAIGHYEAALRIRPEYAKAHYNLGLALWQAGQRQEAVGQYEQAVRINPDFPEAHLNLGITLSQVGSNQDAIIHFREAARLRPDSPEAHCYLGMALFQDGQVLEAAEHFGQALRIKPDYVDAHFDLGLASEKLGRTPEAIEQYQQALKLRPDYVPAKTALTRLGAGQ